MTDSQILATGLLGILALMLLYAHALGAGLPEPVVDPVWSLDPAAINWVDRKTFRKIDNELIARFERWKRRDPEPRDLLRWADDGGPA